MAHFTFHMTVTIERICHNFLGLVCLNFLSLGKQWLAVVGKKIQFYILNVKKKIKKNPEIFIFIILKTSIKINNTEDIR